MTRQVNNPQAPVAKIKDMTFLYDGIRFRYFPPLVLGYSNFGRAKKNRRSNEVIAMANCFHFEVVNGKIFKLMQSSGVIEMNMSCNRLHRFRADKTLLLARKPGKFQIPKPVSITKSLDDP